MRREIIHVINSLGYGGAEVLLCNTIKLMPEYDHVLVTLTTPLDQLKEISPFIKHHYHIESLTKLCWPSGIVRLRRIIKRRRPALVHAHLQVAGIIAKLATPATIPLLYSLHNMYSLDAFAVNRFALPIERLTTKSYHHLLGVSAVALKDYRNFIDKNYTEDVLYNMVGLEFFDAAKPRKYPLGTELRCISVGNLKSQKNHTYTILSFSLLRDLPITLDIYGEGSDFSELESLIRNLELQNVRLMGKRSNISSLITDYHLYIISSKYEGFGIAPLEAMAAGIPVLASDIPVFREVADDAVCYFDLANDGDLASLLTRCFNGVVDLEALALKGQARARQIAHPDTYRTALANIYQKYSL